jgi:hypothetical protein
LNHAALPVLFYGLAIQCRELAGLSPLVTKYSQPVEACCFVTELCGKSLDKLPLGIGKIPGVEIWEMIVQVAAGMQV